MHCSSPNCKRTANGIPVVKIPARGISEDIMEPLVVINKMPMCNRCVGKCELKNFLTEEVRARVIAGTRDRQPVDFSRAYMARMKLSPRQLTQLMEGEKNAS